MVNAISQFNNNAGYYSNTSRNIGSTSPFSLNANTFLDNTKTQNETLGNITKFYGKSSSFLAGLHKNMSSLKNASAVFSTLSLRRIGSEQNSVFAERIAESSDTGVASVAASSTGRTGQTRLNVLSLASAKESYGGSLNASAHSSFRAGQNSFNITDGGGRTSSFFFASEDGESNLDSLNKMAKAINDDENAGVSASVERDAETDEARIVLRSDRTGAANGFTITSSEGNAVEAAGLDRRYEQNVEANDAAYRLNNGFVRYSEDNIVSLDGENIVATLNGTGETTISLTRNQASVEKGVRDFADAFNNNMMFLYDNSPSFRGARQIQSDLQSIVTSQHDRLEAIGVTQDSTSGLLSVDSDTLRASVMSNATQLESIFTGSNGVATRTFNLASRVSRTQPQSRATLGENSLSPAGGYGYQNLVAASGYQNNRYSTPYLSGLFLNMQL